MAVESFNPSSSHIDSVSYDDETKVATVEFASGSTYAYDNMPPETYQAWREAPSAGQFFHRQVKGKYSYREL